MNWLQYWYRWIVCGSTFMKKVYWILKDEESTTSQKCLRLDQLAKSTKQVMSDIKERHKVENK